MSDTRSHVVSLLRAEFAEEAAAGFPRLNRIPQTSVVRFLDYFACLKVEDQSDLLDALAAWGFVTWFDPNRSDITTAGSPAFPFELVRCWTLTRESPLFNGGYRYQEMKLLTAIPEMQEFGGYEKWVARERMRGVPELAFQPPEDLLPDLSLIKCAKSTLVRKLVDRTLKEHGFALEKAGGGWHCYLGPSGDYVSVDVGSSFMGQLRYGIKIVRGPFHIRRLSYEALWQQVGGWDYLTEENTARSVAFLTDLIADTISLVERISLVTQTRDNPRDR